MNGKSVTGIRRIINAGRYSMLGLRAAFRHEAAFRQELLLCLLLFPAALWLGRTGTERALLAGSLLLVPLVELLNSAVESTVDRFGNEHNELSGRAKDLGSAAVFLALLNVPLVWALVLLA